MAPERDVEGVCFDAPHTTDASLQLLKFDVIVVEIFSGFESMHLNNLLGD